MEDWQVALQVEAMALMVNVEGMKATNQERVSNSEDLAYTEEDFVYISSELNRLAEHIKG